MNNVGRWMAAAVCAVVLAAQVAEAGLSVGGKLWYVGFADPVLNWRTDYPGGYSDNQMKLDNVALVGPKFELTFPESPFWVSGMLLYGSTEGDIEGPVVDSWGSQVGSVDGSFDFTLTDAELLAGYSYNVIDVGIGVRHTTWEAAKLNYNMVFVDGSWIAETLPDSELTIFGPVVYLGAGSQFGDSPMGWYAGGSFMFIDLGDEEDGEHFNIEAGIFFSKGHISATGGYRMKKFLNYDDSNSEDGDTSQSGLAVSASFAF